MLRCCCFASLAAQSSSTLPRLPTHPPAQEQINPSVLLAVAWQERRSQSAGSSSGKKGAGGLAEQEAAGAGGAAPPLAGLFGT